MADDAKSGPKGGRQEFDIRLDGLFGELGKAVTSALERLEEGASEVRRVQDIQTPRGPVRAEAGVRVRVGGATFSAGAGGSDDAEYEVKSTQGTSAKPKPKPAGKSAVAHKISATEMREQGVWSLSADLPGIAAEEVSLSCQDGQLHICAASDSRVYEGIFDLPSGVTRERIEMSLINGILDLTAEIEEGRATI